uniref:Intraflagellar transport protein 43 n=2 Tax=Hemiselmis andersenii TaxID=464988 RepID=A0A7S1DFL6_HEMAN|mmetsp:Transcript_12399/g.30241  ORF Transcript_12399/g.30241 Transcript_12399/m.30241 type:complete len:207 (+) Transcript_12399:242-862(+)|eukprot:CAMPEP_0114127400 /NCGR_PEP_ID=MMETSP0043_2-20121206/10358_1 /TAXON_ID=464988 /ORGANISM="Hemiselmis andersenii, Strain CCMP644" /LENGTH=206 /DNA_ID=CAMNT_0001220479 /DNA_START=225 /DNA_END=845 /DNA_ORIENTATION=-
MSGAFIDETGNLEGALREKPRVPVRGRNRRQAQQDDEDVGVSSGNSPGAKPPKQGGWGADDGAGEARAAQAGRRAENTTAISGMNDDGKRQDDDDGDTLVIPDLEEADEDDMTLLVAEPGMIDQGALPINLHLDDGQLPSSQVDGLDLSLLYEFLLPKKSLVADDEPWDADTMLNRLKQSMQQEEDDKAGAGGEAESKAPSQPVLR